MSRRLFFVEKMTVLSWFIEILPRLAWWKFKNWHRAGCCHVIDSSRLSLFVAKLMAKITGYDLGKLEFRLIDVRDRTA